MDLTRKRGSIPVFLRKYVATCYFLSEGSRPMPLPLGPTIKQLYLKNLNQQHLLHNVVSSENIVALQM